jgi:hypothetical protein
MIGLFILFCGLGNIVTKIVGKKKVLVEKDHIGLNVKETESDLSMADRLKLERHWHLS